MSVGRTGGSGSAGTTSLTQRASLSLKYEVSLALRNASRLSCFVPEAALAKPGSSKTTHESLFISLKERATSRLSVFTSISVPARTVLWLPVTLKSLPLRTRAMGCSGGLAGAAAAAAICCAGPAPGFTPRPAPGPAAPARGAAPAGGPKPRKYRRPTSPVHTEAFQVGWILHLSSVAGLSNSPSLSRT